MKGLEPAPCIVYRMWFTDSSCHGSLCAWRLTVLSLLRPDVAPAFFLSSRPALPCPPASCPCDCAMSYDSWCPLPCAVLPVPYFPLPARRGIRLCVSWGLHGDATFPRLRRCWRLGVSNHAYRPLAQPSQALDVVARTRHESLGVQRLIVAATPGLSQERR